MFGILAGIVLIVVGLGWGAIVFMAVSMADRPTANAELAPALWGLLPILIGLAFICG